MFLSLWLAAGAWLAKAGVSIFRLARHALFGPELGRLT
jgi:hypothetical protein